MVEAPRQEEETRPAAVLAVYTWDMLLAILAVFQALAPFAGAVVNSRGETVPLSLPVQILLALSSAASAATLIIVASLLTRRRRWVRLMQMVVMGVSIALAAISLLVDVLIGADLPLASVLLTLLILLLDLLALVLMTERRLVAWYREPGAPPRYITGTVLFWVLSGCAAIGLLAALR
ncbi:MAG TPA: hypothetical protein VJU79_07035 [Candidatus Dormibacteraeota bacterium]|nr:hypothetical protein [Candidatus Dormibacteraeota bacterium]